jgi:ABC-type multidrug transport system ATPase subunit
MSAGILRALMQLFAIISGSGIKSGREIVALFLRQQLNKEMVNNYLKLYEEFAEKFHDVKDSEKKTSMASVKVLRICSQINEELQQKEKFFVVVRLLEFLREYTEHGPQELAFVETVADAFNIDRSLYSQIQEHVDCTPDALPDHSSYLVASAERLPQLKNAQFLSTENLKGQLLFLRLEEENIFFVRYFGPDALNLNSQHITPLRTYVFGQGSSIRGSKISPVFYSDVLHRYLQTGTAQAIVYRAEDVSYYFPGTSSQALHQFNLMEDSGTLVGIMGGSGAGKSTCLNVLNGNYLPSYGKITLNGIDIHREKDKIQGVLGYVAQDDLLIEELTVFENLYYNAKLCFAGMTNAEIAQRVDRTLQSVGLFECKDLRVGSVLDKTISGGQRKRLNIALELIREPAVLFIDEPTSGLSSRDSENIMDLLKELTLRGKLIFTVIHQPSSDIFKMLDKLFILDQGGYPIYYGNPVESIIYFKRLANQVNLTESECPYCGNVNPEQIFNIIEAKVVDEYGNETEHRKVTPAEWNNFFNVMIGNHLSNRALPNETPQSASKLPKAFAQFKVFVKRDVLSKVANRQYMLINFLEAPILAAVLSLFIKYYPTSTGGLQPYTFRENLNFPQYLFISVVVAIFLGLTVSAEEIIKDQKILKREKYLSLSKGSYLSGKMAILFFISLIQSLSFVLVGNTILEVKGMLLPFWLVLFSTSCFANVLGLNISASFNSAKVIYIIIPILIIPQLLLSGVIVRFDRLYPGITNQARVPWIGNTMVARWAYEAMAVYQFKNNDFEKDFFPYDRDRKYYAWKKDYWLKELKNRSSDSQKLLGQESGKAQLASNLTLLRNELTEECMRIPDYSIPQLELLHPEVVTVEALRSIDTALIVLDRYYINNYNDVNDRKEMLITELTATPELRTSYLRLQDDCYNESLEDFVTNKNDLKKIVEAEGHLIQKQNPVFLDPTGGFFNAHYYAPSKLIFGQRVSTLSANVLVIWLMTLSLAILLAFDALKKFLDTIARAGKKK